MARYVHDDGAATAKKVKKLKKFKCFHLYTLLSHLVYTSNVAQTWLINQLDANANMSKERNIQNSIVQMELKKTEILKFRSSPEKYSKL